MSSQHKGTKIMKYVIVKILYQKKQYFKIENFQYVRNPAGLIYSVVKAKGNTRGGVIRKGEIFETRTRLKIGPQE